MSYRQPSVAEICTSEIPHAVYSRKEVLVYRDNCEKIVICNDHHIVPVFQLSVLKSKEIMLLLQLVENVG